MTQPQNHLTMAELHKSQSSNEKDVLRQLKEELQIEMVSSSGLSSLRLQFLHETIGMLNLRLAEDDDELMA